MVLDAFWSSASSAVNANKNKVKQMLNFSALIGTRGPFDYEGPFPDFDYCGYEVAAEMLLYSTQPGKYGRDYLQYDTIRKFQSTFGNVLKSSPKGASQNWGMLDDAGRYKRIVDDPCAS